ncbi:peptidase C13 [Dyella sp.]|uniref:peptidase C13 n=1 Tax=Dyella sp. TaxID=1869338 RepID=UPI002ED61AFD
MRTVLAIALLLVTICAFARDDFDQRVQAAKMAEGTATGPAYQRAFWDKTGNPMTDALKSCIKSNEPADKSPFTLVADISADGHPQRVDVRAPTPLARCLAGQFSGWTFPKPPLKEGASYPVEIDVSVTQ